MKWQPKIHQSHSWSWSLPELPNGWTATVADDPASGYYLASAKCQWWTVRHPRYFEEFDEAKRESLRLALAQGKASSDPRCKVQPESLVVGQFGFLLFSETYVPRGTSVKHGGISHADQKGI